MKITIVAMEIPYPPIHGGRVDIWRRIEAFEQLGVEVQLICWIPEEPKAEDLAVIYRSVKNLQLLQYTGRTPLSKLRRCCELLRYPFGITSRLIYGLALQRLLGEVKQFQPDLIWIDGIHASVLARTISECLGIPFVVRSHNIEHQHRAALLRAAQGLQKIPAFLVLMHLKALEISILKNCLAFFDISVDDLKFWQNCGLQNGYFLPPLANLSKPEPADFDLASSCASLDRTCPGAFHVKQYDIVFLGNLNSDNNVAGIKWFLDAVVPLIQTQKADVSILIAGSKPVPMIRELCEQATCVDLKINPKSAIEIYASGRVLVNPIAMGGGVSIKSIDMLTLGKPIVSLAKGIAGLPESVKPLFRLATDAPSFAEAVMICLSEASLASAEMSQVSSEPISRVLSPVERQSLIEDAFGLPKIQQLIDQLQMLLVSQKI